MPPIPLYNSTHLNFSRVSSITEAFCLQTLFTNKTLRSSSWLHIHIRIFAYSSTSYGTPNIYKCFRFPVLLNTTDILLGILFDYTTLHRVTIIMPPPVGGGGGAGALSGDRRLSSVCLSDVAYIGSNSKTKRPRKTKLCTGYPRSHATPTPTSRPKGQKSRSRGGAYCGGHIAAQLVFPKPLFFRSR